MRRFRLRPRTWIALGVVGVVAAALSVAGYAYFTSSGSGSGTATVGSSGGWSVAVTSPSGGPLFPGSGSEQFNYTVTNTGSGPAALGSVVYQVNPNWSQGACNASDFSIDGAAAGSPFTENWSNTVVPGGGSVSWNFTVTMVDNGQNQNDCQGQSVPVQVIAS